MEKVKELFEDKPKLIKYIYDKIDRDKSINGVRNEELIC